VYHNFVGAGVGGARLNYGSQSSFNALLRTGAFGLVGVDADEQGAFSLRGGLRAQEDANKKAKSDDASVHYWPKKSEGINYSIPVKEVNENALSVVVQFGVVGASLPRQMAA
jgi:hypothetical protein